MASLSKSQWFFMGSLSVFKELECLAYRIVLRIDHPVAIPEKGNLLDAADERLGVDFDKNEMECFLIVGLWCTHPSSKERPKAGQVIKVFQLEAPLPKLPHIMPDYPMPQPQQKAQSGSSQSQLFLTSGFNTMGR
ncbi:probable L-type lectin-domain containing receptor kinase S.7 [Rosa chinensis]|uniref:probable L-type lectin-domain containing receptor kinase S.7 n=1 Tax=Rosa chinensis TaxID=74649 RepID=UPI000D090BCD|nr:probable L-type lectin-domain containing receptor kinase S.7 [Rosa chinensis]